MCVERRAGLLATGLLAVVVAMLAGCAPSQQELWRLTSPDGRVDAVFVEVNGGATVDFAYNLFIVPAMGRKQALRNQLRCCAHLQFLQLLAQPHARRLEIYSRDPPRAT
jgi:hypothetical protein